MGKRKVSEPRIVKTGVAAKGISNAGITREAQGGLGGVAFPSSNTSSFFYSPELTTESFLLPKSRVEILKWCRIFYNLDPYVSSIIDMHADYPLSKFDIITSDPSVTQFYKEAVSTPTFDLYTFLRRASLSYWKFGEAIPFGNLIHDEKDNMWKWHSFILLEPELIEIRQEVFEDNPRFELVPTEELKKLVRSVDPVALERQKAIPDVVMESVKNNRMIPLDPDRVSMIARITDPSATRGTPVIQRLFKILIYQDWIRMAQSSFAQRYVYPVELWQIGDAAKDIWPNEADLEKFKNTINLAVQNPPFSLVFPPIVKYDALSTSGKSFFPITNEYTYIQDQIMVGLGVNKNVILGEGPSFSNAKTMSLHKLMMVYKTIRDEFENWMLRHFFMPLAVKNNLYKTVRGKKEYILPTISWYKSLDIEERDVERKLYYDFWKDGIISTQTLFGKFPDLDYTTESLNLEKERGTVFDKGTGKSRIPMGVTKPAAGGGDLGSRPPGAGIGEGLGEGLGEGGGAGAGAAPGMGEAPKAEVMPEMPGMPEPTVAPEGPPPETGPAK